MTRDYYNRRMGGASLPKLTLRETAESVAEQYSFANDQCYLQRSFGYHCVDDGAVAGREGFDMQRHFHLETGLGILGSVADALRHGDEIFLFTFIEYVHDHVAVPVAGGRHHSYSNCGWHYDQSSRFDVAAGRLDWRTRVNKFLRYYEGGYELSEAGEIQHIAPDGMRSLLQAPVPLKTGQGDRERVAAAVRTFQLARSTRQDRKHALRDLIDVLEFHRKHFKTNQLSKDENDLFQVANRFALRHHDHAQQDDYDDTFLGWLFYTYLAMTHLILSRVTGAPAFVVQPEVVLGAHEEIEDLPF